MRTGYYSVLYDRSTYDRIAADFASLSQYDKGGLMNDLFLFLQAGKIGPELYYRFVSLCSKVSEPLVVQAVTDQLVFLNSIAGDARRIRECMMSFLTSQIHRLGILPAKGEDERRKDVREAVSSQLAMVDISFARSWPSGSRTTTGLIQIPRQRLRSRTPSQEDPRPSNPSWRWSSTRATSWKGAGYTGR